LAVFREFSFSVFCLDLEDDRAVLFIGFLDDFPFFGFSLESLLFLREFLDFASPL